mgnify:CR=1 FL=1
MSPTYLNQYELAARFRISPRTLERWRWRGTGIAFVIMAVFLWVVDKGLEFALYNLILDWKK